MKSEVVHRPCGPPNTNVVEQDVGRVGREAQNRTGRQRWACALAVDLLTYLSLLRARLGKLTSSWTWQAQGRLESGSGRWEKLCPLWSRLQPCTVLRQKVPENRGPDQQRHSRLLYRLGTGVEGRSHRCLAELSDSWCFFVGAGIDESCTCQCKHGCR